jgi:hypothetical protein
MKPHIENIVFACCGIVIAMTCAAVSLQGCNTQTSPEGQTVQVIEADTITAAVYQFYNNKQAQIDRALQNPSLSPEQRAMLNAEYDRLNNTIAGLVTALNNASGYHFIITIQVVPGEAKTATPDIAPKRAVVDEPSPHADGTTRP